MDTRKRLHWCYGCALGERSGTRITHTGEGRAIGVVFCDGPECAHAYVQLHEQWLGGCYDGAVQIHAAILSLLRYIYIYVYVLSLSIYILCICI